MNAVRASAWLATFWAVVFGTLAGLALLGRTPHPWAPGEAAVLAGMPAAAASWLLLAIALLVGGSLALGSLVTGRRTAGWALVVLGLVVALVLSDVRALSFLGYLPMILLALVGVGPLAGHLSLEPLVVSAAALAHAVGGVAIVVTGTKLLAHRPGTWTAWARWDRPAVAVAVAVPLLYAATRIAWALDIPLGIRPETLDELGSARYAGLGLALFAVVGAWLTSGLVARWGEVFWTWVPRVGGRPVPVALALVPGLVVAGTVTTGGLSFWRLVLTGELAKVPGATADWAAWAPELLWPVWGVALAVACLAYLGRRELLSAGTGEARLSNRRR